MALDAGQAAMLVRATARVSAVILSGDLLVAARRIGIGGGTDPERTAPRALRKLDIRVFVAFIVSHTVHFICVGLLTIATAGANIDARTGYAPVIAVGILFYLACAVVWRVKLRSAAGWVRPKDRAIEVWTLVAIWLAFFQAYITRPLQWWFFPVLAIVLLYALARFVSAALRSGGRYQLTDHASQQDLDRGVRAATTERPDREFEKTLR